MTELFKVATVCEARRIIWEEYIRQQKIEIVPLLEALGRRTAKEIFAGDNLPGFTRSTMDGFAVRARDTFGASESLPAYLEIAGEVLMGQEPMGRLEAGKAWRIATGGMLPQGADAVVMVEYTENLDEDTIGVVRPVAPGENLILKGEDVVCGSPVLQPGNRIKAQDLGVLAAAGVTSAEVFCKTRVGIISTGDEIVPPDQKPPPGKVRDINSYSLFGAIVEAGGEPVQYGIAGDDFQRIHGLLALAVEDNDIVLLTGGSSVGTKDMAVQAISSLGKPGVLFHGLAIKPGKPAIGAVVSGKPVFGLPGHPASALVVFYLLIDPLIRLGSYPKENEEFLEFPVCARITRNLRSAPGRDDFVQVRLVSAEGELCAEPVLGKSGLISTLVNADGLARIPAGKEGVQAGEIVRIKLF
ncbi:MAG TPA: molybdopterin molybdenumtransferase MoeA [Desulfotomaculum sp.]|nr:molybdopterin molybdenumtransferase MoeA [Desulfotomaculum sp.]